MKRKYRDREYRENGTIVIPVIICLAARAQGTQYTKRVLPEFLIPHSVIRLDHLLEAADLPEYKQTEAAVCDLLGCLDPRTARHLMDRLAAAFEVVSLDLAGRRAAMPELGELPEISPETPMRERLIILFESEIRSSERAGGNHSLPSLRQLLQAVMGKHPGKKPSDCASPLAQPP